MKHLLALFLVLISIVMCACGAVPQDSAPATDAPIPETSAPAPETETTQAPATEETTLPEPEAVELDPNLTADPFIIVENEDVTISFVELRYDEKHKNIWVTFEYDWPEEVSTDVSLENVVVNDSISLENVSWNIDGRNTMQISTGLLPITEQGLSTAEKITGTISYQLFDQSTLSYTADKFCADFEIFPYLGEN